MAGIIEQSSTRRATNKRAIGALIQGFASGIAGTAAMTVTQKIEIRITGRKASTSPAEALCVLLGFESRTQEQESRLAAEVHWVYGTMLGFGHLVLEGIPEPERSLVFLLLTWSAGAGLLRASGVAPPPTKWSNSSLALDIAHHAIYAVSTAAAAHAMKRVCRVVGDPVGLRPKQAGGNLSCSSHFGNRRSGANA